MSDDAAPTSKGWLLDRLEERVLASGDSVALAHGDDTMTYTQLDTHANKLAHHLRNHGIGPETVVGVTLHHGFPAVISLLAVLKAGGIYLPLDTRHPTDRLTYMTTNADTRLILTDHKTTLPPLPTPVITYDDTPDTTPTPPPEPRTTPDSASYIVYTSGSTGKPKGITATLRTLLPAVRWLLSRDGAAARCVQLASIGFDVSLLEILGTLLSGGVLVLIDDEHRQDPEKLLQLLAQQRVERLYTSPAQLHHIALAWTERKQPLFLSEVLVSGDVVHISDPIRQMLSSIPGVVLENQYGPSETHHATANRLTTPPTQWPTNPTIGTPIPDTHIYLLDHHLNPTPIGATGEIYIAGKGLTRGYTNQPTLTAQRFIADPHTGNGQRMYRTGDIARHTTNGQLQFLGRADNQIKIRGHRVEPAEIETTIAQHPHINDVAVIAHTTPTGPQLTAYIVTTPHTTITNDDLRNTLKNKLPDYMHPTTTITIPHLPLNTNGKLDTTALPKPTPTRPTLTTTYTAPRNTQENLITAIWTDILGITGIGIDDNFFTLGGHSLLATQVISRTRTTFQTKTPVRTIFENPTIRTLAKAIEKEAPIRKQALPPGDRSRLSFAQQRLWFLDQLLPGVPLYNVDTVWRLTGALSHTHFKQAFVEVVARHETLRSRFHDDGGQPRQIIDTSTSVELSIEDLSGLAPAEAEARGRQIASESAVRPFDLAGGPLLRAQLVRLNDHEHLLVLVFHHAVIDGWSMVIFWRELTLLYDALSAGRVAELPPLRVGYAEYTAWQRLWLDSDDAAADLAYWRRTLQDAPRTTELPADHPRPAMLSGAGRLVRFDLPAQTADALRHLGVTQGATTFMVLLTAFTMLLSRYTGTSDLVTGVPSAGRALTEFEDLVGFFVNPLPVRLRWSGDPTFTELLGTTREAMLDAVAHQNMPFDRLVEELVDGRDLSRNPLFQVWFDVDSSPEVAQPKDLGVALVPLDTGNTRFDLEMRLEDRPDRLTGTLCYSTDIFADETAERLVRHFQHVLANVAAAPEERLSRLSRPDEHQQRLVLDVWSRCTTPGTTAIDDVMAKYQQRVVASGDSVALAHGDDTMTYTQLDTHANQLAHHLRNHGIGPETVVGVTLHHGFPAVISLLAVLKAGGIYLPLDTRHPTDRLTYMTTNADTRLILTDHKTTLPPLPTPVITYDDTPDTTPTPPPEPRTTPDSASYIVYTSGSTGKPKGITATLRTLASFTAPRVTLSPGPSCVQLASIGFDVYLQEVFGTLLSGGVIVLADDEHRQDPAHLIRLMAQQRVQRLFLSPSLLHQVALTWAEEKPQLALAEIIVGGEKLTLTPEIRTFVEAHPGIVLENQYGPSETHHATANRLTTPPTQWPTNPTIGTPIPDTHIYLLDHHLNPTPIGATGEIYIAGKGLTRGYTNQPTLTAQRFIADPHTGNGQRMYRTGDIARHTTNGQLQFLGRADNQIKIRGHRVEPAEIETTIAQHPHINDVAVIAHTTPTGPQLTAYIVTTPHTTITNDDLRNTLKNKLPDYMHPTTTITIPHLPLNTNGKLDTTALPKPTPTRPTLTTTYTAPRNTQENLITAIWTDILGITGIGIDDNFFTLGGHSLLATQVISRTRTTFQTKTPVRTIFENPTIRTLAKAIEQEVIAEVAALSVDEMHPTNVNGDGTDHQQRRSDGA